MKTKSFNVVYQYLLMNDLFKDDRLSYGIYKSTDVTDPLVVFYHKVEILAALEATKHLSRIAEYEVRVPVDGECNIILTMY